MWKLVLLQSIRLQRHFNNRLYSFANFYQKSKCQICRHRICYLEIKNAYFLTAKKTPYNKEEIYLQILQKHCLNRTNSQYNLQNSSRIFTFSYRQVYSFMVGCIWGRTIKGNGGLWRAVDFT